MPKRLLWKGEQKPEKKTTDVPIEIKKARYSVDKNEAKHE